MNKDVLEEEIADLRVSLKMLRKEFAEVGENMDYYTRRYDELMREIDRICYEIKRKEELLDIINVRWQN